MGSALIVAFVLAALVIVSERAVRLYISRWSRPYLHVPGSRTECFLYPEFAPLLSRRVIRYDVNSNGERGGPVPRTGSVYRVLVIGGSAAECGALDQQETWAAQLEQLLSTPESLARLGVSRVHVGLLGRSQLDSRALEIVIDALLPHYSGIDLIVVMNGTSDPLRWLEAGAPAGAVPKPYSEGIYLARSRQHEYTWQRPALVHYLLKSVVLRTRVEHRPSFGKKISKEAAARNAVQHVHLASDPSAMFGTFETTMARVLPKLKQKADRVIVVRQPWLGCADITRDEERNLWSGRLGVMGSGPSVFLCNASLASLCRGIDERTVRVAAEAGVQSVDLMPALEAARIGTYFYDHFHFTPAGARVVAEALAEHVLSPAMASAAVHGARK